MDKTPPKKDNAQISHFFTQNPPKTHNPHTHKMNMQTETTTNRSLNTTTNNNNNAATNSNKHNEQIASSSTGGATNRAMAPEPARSPSPDGTRDYDVTRMREEDFERLAVYIVPDVQCERGLANRADKTLPRSLTLKPSLVFSSANVKVKKRKHRNLYSTIFNFILSFFF